MDERSKKHGWPYRCAVVLIVLPFVYIGSLGPLCAFIDRGHIPQSTLKTVYWPCLYLVKEGPHIVSVSLWLWSGLFGNALINAAMEDVGLVLGTDGEVYRTPDVQSEHSSR